MKIYDILNKEIYLENQIIYIHICNIGNFLDVFNILEIFFLLSKYSNEKINSIELVGDCDGKGYIERVNFIGTLKYLFGITKTIEYNSYTGNSDLLQEIKLFKNKNEFIV